MTSHFVCELKKFSFQKPKTFSCIAILTDSKHAEYSDAGMLNDDAT